MDLVSNDPYRLQRFVEAQDQAGTYERALAELQVGQKTSHWMWFVFPQIAGLGSSSMARTYAIASLEEAQAYLDHPVLGPRLLTCSNALLGITGKTAEDIFDETDAIKLRSSMTLFSRVSGEPVFQQVLDRYFEGKADEVTEQRL